MQNNRIGTDLCAGCARAKCSDPSSGCAEYRSRFVEWWDTNIHREITPRETKPLLQYEHPEAFRYVCKMRDENGLCKPSGELCIETDYRVCRLMRNAYELSNTKEE